MLRSLTQLFSSNLLAKLLALLLAGVVYAYVYAEREHDATWSVPLLVSGLGPGLVLMEDPPEMVEVAFRAKGSQLLKLKMQSPEVILDLARVGPGVMQHLLSPGDVRFPVDAQATVRGIMDPRVVLLDVDSLVTRELPVEVPLRGELPEAWAWDGEVRVDPRRVRVQGPERQLLAMVAVGTPPVRLDTISGSGSFRLPVLAGMPGLLLQPDSVTVTVPVIPVTRRSLSGIAVEVVGPRGAEFVRAMPESVTILVSGPDRLLIPLESGQVRVFLEAGHLEPGLHRLAPRVALPHDSLQVRAILPSEFLVEVGPRRGTSEPRLPN
jgi:hypothetical protein